MIKPRGFDSFFIKRVRLTPDAYTFYFQRPSNFKFNSGQYLKMILKQLKNPDERGNFRYFTISSSPTEKDYLTVTTRIIKSSFKKNLASLRKNAPVRIFGPLEGVDFDPKDKRQRVYLAGGIGITPAHSIIRFLATKKLRIPFVLFSSFKTLADHVFYQELKEIEKNNSWFKFVPSIKRIDAALIKNNVKNLKSSLFYITGPEQMVLALSEVVESLGVKQKNIQKETFPGY